VCVCVCVRVCVCVVMLFPTDGNVRHLQREIQILSRTNHSNVGR